MRDAFHCAVIILFIFFSSFSCHCATQNQLPQYDIEKGLLLKLDSFLQIQLGTVFRGLTRVPDEEVLNLYRNRIIPIQYVEGEKGSVRSNVAGCKDQIKLFDSSFFAGKLKEDGSTR